MDVDRLRVYGERVRPRIATPLDHYFVVFTHWVEQLWFVWAAIGAVVVIIVIIVAISRARTRAHARVPHYRRVETGPITVTRLRQPTGRVQPRARRS